MGEPAKADRDDNDDHVDDCDREKLPAPLDPGEQQQRQPDRAGRARNPVEVVRGLRRPHVQGLGQERRVGLGPHCPTRDEQGDENTNDDVGLDEGADATLAGPAEVEPADRAVGEQERHRPVPQRPRRVAGADVRAAFERLAVGGVRAVAVPIEGRRCERHRGEREQREPGATLLAADAAGQVARRCQQVLRVT